MPFILDVHHCIPLGAATTDISQTADLGLIGAILLLGGVFFVSTILEKYLSRFGIPSILSVLLISLALVVIIGRSPMGWSYQQLHVMHTLSLALILFYAGIETRISDIRSFARYGITLAVAGVMISSFLVGGLFYLITSKNALGLDLGVTTSLPLGVALLIGACLGSTDAGPTLSILQNLGDVIPEKVKGIIKFESAVNDPAALVFFNIVMEFFFQSRTADTFFSVRQAAEDLFEAFGTGLLVGGIFGIIGIWLINNFVMERSQLLLASISIACLAYGTSSLLEGSGFISAFIAGMFLNNSQVLNEDTSPTTIAEVLVPFDSAAEVFIILLFGLSVDPADLLDSMPAGLVMAVLLMGIARPVSVLIFNRFSPLSFRRSLLLSWCGLRGAVPLALSFEAAHLISEQSNLLPGALLSDLATDANSIVFIVVITNLLVQSTTIAPLARWVNRTEAEQATPSARPQP